MLSVTAAIDRPKERAILSMMLARLKKTSVQAKPGKKNTSMNPRIALRVGRRSRKGKVNSNSWLKSISPYLIEHLGLRWTGYDFIYAKANEKPVAFDPTARESGPPALLVDFQELFNLLKSEGMTIVWTILGEKNIYVPTFQDREYKGRLEVFGVAVLQNQEVRLIDLINNFHAPSEH